MTPGSRSQVAGAVSLLRGLGAVTPVLEALGISGFIPDGNLFTIDVADIFNDIQEDSFKGFLETIVKLLQIILPDPPDGVFD